MLVARKPDYRSLASRGEVRRHAPAVISKFCGWGADSRSLKGLNYWKSGENPSTDFTASNFPTGFFCTLYGTCRSPSFKARGIGCLQVKRFSGEIITTVVPTYLKLNSRLAKGQTQNWAPSGDAAPDVPLRFPSNYLGPSAEYDIPGAAATSSTQEWASSSSGAIRSMSLATVYRRGRNPPTGFDFEDPGSHQLPHSPVIPIGFFVRRPRHSLWPK
ncbi:hypothetical protein C8R46DRAFT_1034758 [Mycena filopes]|nr:hypothetical protein C8R46DRAFT_1034758 [Mycena filopes]